MLQLPGSIISEAILELGRIEIGCPIWYREVEEVRGRIANIFESPICVSILCDYLWPATLAEIFEKDSEPFFASSHLVSRFSLTSQEANMNQQSLHITSQLLERHACIPKLQHLILSSYLTSLRIPTSSSYPPPPSPLASNTHNACP